MDHAALRFEARLQGASQQAMSQLDGAQALQDALESRLDILESQWVNSVAISYMALSLAAIAYRALASPLLSPLMVGAAPAAFSLPALLLCPFMAWAAVSRWKASKDLRMAWYEANRVLKKAHAEGLAVLEACQSQAMDDLAELRLRESRLDRRVQLLQLFTEERIRLDMARVKKHMERQLRPLRSGLMGDPGESQLESALDSAGSHGQSRRELTGKRISSEVAEVKELMGRGREVLQSRLDHVYVRKNLLFDQWRHITCCTLWTTFLVVCPGNLTPFNICFWMLACLMPASWRMSGKQLSLAHARQARALWSTL